MSGSILSPAPKSPWRHVGGGIGLVVALVWVLLGGGPTTGGTLGGLVDQTVGGGAGEPGPASTALANECQTGADANAREDCRVVGYINSIQAYWTDEFAASGQRYPSMLLGASPGRPLGHKAIVH